MKKIKNLFAAFLIIYLCFYIFTSSADAVDSVKNSVYACLNTIIPSLFAFMVVTDFLQRSGLHLIVTKPVSFALSKIFKIDENLISLFLLSQIGGFPVGASLVKNIAEDKCISKELAEKLLASFFCSGPTFIICGVALQCYNNPNIGFIMYFGIVISNLIIFIVTCKTNKNTKMDFPSKISFGADMFISSVNNGTKSICKVCSMIVFFSIIVSSLSFIGSYYVNPLLEISKITEIRFPPYVCSALISFGGVCVLIQISTITSGKIRMKYLLLSRVPVCILSYLITYILFEIFFHGDIAYCYKFTEIYLSRQASIFPSVLLMIMSLMLITVVNRQNAQ